MNRLSEGKGSTLDRAESEESRRLWLEAVARMAENEKLQSRLDSLERRLAIGPGVETKWQF